MSEESNKNNKDENNVGDGVKFRVRSWVSGITNEMRKKSHVTVQKWISVTEEEKNNCDSNELNINEPSTSGGSGASVKGKITEICNKFNVNEKLKSKKIELKNLISKTTQKIKRESSKEEKTHHNMDQNQQNMYDDETRNKQCDNEIEQIKDDVNDTVNNKENESNINDRGDNEDGLANDESEEVETNEEENKSEPNKLTAQRCHISVLGRSSSENPNPRTRRLRDIGRSFSVANDGELPIDSTDNLIYDDEDISIVNPSFNTSPSVLSNKTNSNNQLDKNLALLRPSLGHMRPLREHTVSEGHSSPHVVPKNPLLRDGSFQSDSSHCSSVESLLEARKPDAEAILVNLGFGPVQGSDDVLSKIPKRFLKPSQVRGVDTESFLKNQQLSMNIHENSVLGYRGLLDYDKLEILRRFHPHVSTSRSVNEISNHNLVQKKISNP
ncbi:uncharacterized protein DDB_G0287625 isoform X2 [Chironomus tepperi]|uniref:uncharacterized protein DDB_G0287625 isoform X2 n=1 Tax=Chironomus tepperi TaxID=113505 RepID=UPI00391EE778